MMVVAFLEPSWDCCRIAFLPLFVPNNPYSCVARLLILSFGNSPIIDDKQKQSRAIARLLELWIPRHHFSATSSRWFTHDSYGDGMLERYANEKPNLRAVSSPSRNASVSVSEKNPCDTAVSPLVTVRR